MLSNRGEETIMSNWKLKHLIFLFKLNKYIIQVEHHTAFKGKWLYMFNLNKIIQGEQFIQHEPIWYKYVRVILFKGNVYVCEFMLQRCGRFKVNELNNSAGIKSMW